MTDTSPNRRPCLLPLSGRWLRYGWTLGLWCVVLLAASGERYESSEFCRQCGLRRRVLQFRILGVPQFHSELYRDGRFHELYSRYVSPVCRHSWAQAGGSSMMLLGGGVRDGEISRVFLDSAGPSPQTRVGAQLLAIEHLSDGRKARIVLQALVNQGAGSESVARLNGAFRELKRVRGRREEDAWWLSQGTVFERLAGRSLEHKE